MDEYKNFKLHKYLQAFRHLIVKAKRNQYIICAHIVPQIDSSPTNKYNQNEKNVQSFLGHR